MKKRTLTLIALLTVTIIAAAPLMARPHGRGHDGGFGPLGRLMHAKEELGLSDQQVEEIRGIFRGVRAQNEEYRDELRGGFQEVTATLLANPNDVSGAQAILDRQAAAERAMKQNLLAAAAKALNVLTPQQREKLGELIAERHARFERRRER